MFKDTDNVNLTNLLVIEKANTTINELISINAEMEAILDKVKTLVFNDDIFYKRVNELEELQIKINNTENKIENLLKNIKFNKNEQFEKRWKDLTRRTFVLQNLSCDILIDANFNSIEVYTFYEKIAAISGVYDSLLNKYSLKDLIIKINNELQTINGMSWNTDNTYQEIHNWMINKTKKITHEEINFKFQAINNLDKKLSAGDNLINLIINITNISEQMVLKIQNVILSEKDSFKFINNIFNSAMNFNLYNTNTYSDLLKLIDIKIKQNSIIKIPFKLSLINNRNDDKLDVAKNKEIEIKIAFPKNFYNFNVLVAEIKGGIEQFNFSKINKIITDKTTDHKYNDILNEIKKRLEVLSKYFTVELINVNLDNYLIVGDRDFLVNIIYGDYSKKIIFTIRDIRLSNKHLKEKVEQFLEQTFDFDFNENYNQNNLISILNNKLRQILKNDDFNRIKINNCDLKAEFINDKEETFSKLKVIIDNIELIKKIKFMIRFSEQELEKRAKNFFKQIFNFYLASNDTISSFILKLTESFKRNFGERNQKRVVISSKNSKNILKQANKIIVYHNFQIKVDNNINKIKIKTKLKTDITNLKIQLKQIFGTPFIFNQEFRDAELIKKIWVILTFEFGEEIQEILTISYLKMLGSNIYSNFTTHNINILFENEKEEDNYRVRVQERFSKEKLKQNLSHFLKKRFFLNELNENATLKSVYETFQNELEEQFGTDNANRITIDRINELTKVTPNDEGEDYWDLKFYVDAQFVLSAQLKFEISFTAIELKNRLIKFLDKRFDLNLYENATLKDCIKEFREKLISNFSKKMQCA